MKKTVKIIEIVLTVLLGLILIANISILVRKKLFHDSYPKVLGFGIGNIISGSMTGTINIDDLIVTKSMKQYEVGDIILFHDDTMLVTHRIIEKNEEGFITKGDANNAADKNPVKLDDIEGKVISVLPGFGKVVTFLRTPLGLLIILVLGLAIGFLPELSKKERDAKKITLDSGITESAKELNEEINSKEELVKDASNQKEDTDEESVEEDYT